MVLLRSAESDAEAAGSRAPTWENLRGGIRPLEFGLRRRPVSRVSAWCLRSSLPAETSRAGSRDSDVRTAGWSTWSRFRANGSCARRARRRAEWWAHVVEEVLPDLAFRQLVFTVPRVLRGGFIRERRLLGGAQGVRRDAAVSRRLCVLLDARRRFN